MKKLLEQMEGYQTEVEVSVFDGKPDVDNDHDKKVVVKYNIDIEHRSWGLKDITLSFNNPIQINVWEVTEDDDITNERTLEVDLSEANIMWREGGMFSPTGVNVTLNEDGSVKEVDIECTYINPDYVG